MQAILTTILPCTETKPTRIKVECVRGSAVLSYDSLEGNSDEKHIQAVKILCARFASEDKTRNGTPLNLNSWSRHFVSGETVKGFAHVFIS